jgi:hypothetical protein
MSMIKTSTGRAHKTVRSKDADFSFSPDGITMVPRASFEVSAQCPREYKLIIAECIGNGWLQPVAHMRDVEYTMELLRK